MYRVGKDGVEHTKNGDAPPRSLIAAVGAHGLRTEGHPAPARPLGDAAWKALLEAADFNRVTAHLYAALKDGMLPATDVQVAELRKRLLEWAAHTLRLQAALPGLVEQLVAGTDYRLLKGPALAHADYANPSLRMYTDLDVLVPASSIDRTVERLSTAGAVRRRPEQAPGFDRRFGKGATFHMPAGYELDLHRTLTPFAFGLALDPDTLFERLEILRLGGTEVRILAREERLLHACYHAALGNVPPTVGQLRDVAELLRSAPTDTDRVLSLAERAHALVVVARAIRLTVGDLRLADDAPLIHWAREYVPTRRDRRLLAPYLADKPIARELAILSVLPGWGPRAAYVRARMVPQRSYMATRHGGGYVSHWWRSVLHLLRIRKLR